MLSLDWQPCCFGTGDTIEIWGDGLQTRSFLYVDECIEGILRLMDSEYRKPINIGSDEMVSINDLAKMVIEISGKDLKIKNVESNAIGVRGRNSENTLIEQVLGLTSLGRPRILGLFALWAWAQRQCARLIRMMHGAARKILAALGYCSMSKKWWY